MRILHLADLHLSETATLAGTVIQDPETGLNLALSDTVRAARQIVDAAGQLDGIVIAGDLFDRPRPTPTELRIAADLCAWLATRTRAGRILMIPGNHDLPRSTTEASACTPLAWHPAVQLVETPEVVEYCSLQWACLPYPRRSAMREVQGVEGEDSITLLSAALSTITIGMRSAGAQVLLAHCTIGGATVGAQPRTIEGDIELSRDAIDQFPAVLLGHIHKQQQHRNAWYPGSPTTQDFGEEGEPKGGLLWTLDGNGQVVAVDRIVVEARCWETIEFEGDEIPETLADLALKPGCVFRVRGELPGEVLAQARDLLATARQAGAYVQDELRLLVEDRARDKDIGRQGIDDTEVLRRALGARQVPEPDHDRLVLAHHDVVQGG